MLLPAGPTDKLHCGRARPQPGALHLCFYQPPPCCLCFSVSVYVHLGTGVCLWGGGRCVSTSLSACAHKRLPWRLREGTSWKEAVTKRVQVWWIGSGAPQPLLWPLLHILAPYPLGFSVGAGTVHSTATFMPLVLGPLHVLHPSFLC